MKKIIKTIFNIICFLISLIFNNFVIKYYKKIKYNVLSFNFRRKLKKCGSNISIKDFNLFEGLSCITLGNNFVSHDGLWLATYGESRNIKIEIKDNVRLSRNCHIAAIEHITIGNNVLIGSNVMITDHSHGLSSDFSKPRFQLDLVSKGEIVIGDNCWICDNVSILSGVSIGKNCIIAANSVVNKSFPDNVLIAGTPAKIIKKIKEID